MLHYVRYKNARLVCSKRYTGMIRATDDTESQRTGRLAYHYILKRKQNVSLELCQIKYCLV